MKKFLVAAMIVVSPMAAMADTAPQSTMVEMADADLSGVTGQALNISPAQIIMGLQQINNLANVISPILPSQGKSVVSLINVAATTAPVVNNLVNGGKLSTADLSLLLKNGLTAGVAISKLTNGL
jgi:hypothetical protein